MGSEPTAAELAEIYATIKKHQPEQEKAYAAWLESGAIDTAALTKAAAELGLVVDLPAGTIAYAPDFAAPKLPYELWYCRHGKTGGNTEPRVYQGYVDEPNNALNDVGKGQAEEAADKMVGLGLEPDLVILSPLKRAADTGMVFVNRNPSAPNRVVEEWDDSAEMRFGDWDNVKVKDMAPECIGHLFYLAQNAVVKSTKPYVRPSDGKEIPGENFVETIIRIRAVLDKVTAKVKELPVRAGRAAPVVLMYGHSMAGAALSIVTGNGKQVDGQAFLGFDGKYIMPNATPVCLFKP